MAHKRRARVRYRSVRGGHYGEFGPRYLGYRMPIHVRHYKRARRTRRNPFFANPGRGTNWLLIGAVAVGGFFLLRGGGLTSIFGASAPAGYSQLGTSGYYRGPDGQLYTRTASGGMMLSPTQAPVGSAVEQQLIAAGSRLALPIVGSLATGLSNMLSNLFSGGSATGAIPSSGGTTADVLSGAYAPPTEIAPLPDLPTLSTSDWWSAPDTSTWTYPSLTPPDYGSFAYEQPYTLGVPSLELSLAPLEPLPDYTGGYMGLGRMYFQAGRGGYGLARRSPSGELEARFVRQPPSYR